MTKSFHKLALGVAAAALMAPAAMAQESSEPIIIVQNNWTSQLVLSTVVGLVLEDMGYNVEYAPSDSQLQFSAIANGDMHFQVEAWEGSMKTAFEAAVADEGMIDAGAFARLKPGAILVNVSRAQIVARDALMEALDSGRLGGAGLDVHYQEPAAPDDALKTYANVVLTPHIAVASRVHAVADMEAVVTSLADALNSS